MLFIQVRIHRPRGLHRRHDRVWHAGQIHALPGGIRSQAIGMVRPTVVILGKLKVKETRVIEWILQLAW